jgi:hypothetical protein
MQQETAENLEPQQYQRMYWESDVPMKDLRVGMLQKALVFLGVMFVGLIVVSATVKFPDQLELPFVLKSEHQTQIYTFPFKVYVSQKYVSVGDSVQANQPLVKITSPEIVQLIHQLNTKKSKEIQFNIADKIGYQKQREIVKSSIVQNDIQIQNTKDQLRFLEKNWQSEKQKLVFELNDCKDKLERNKTLYESKYISQVEWKQLETNHIKAVTSLENAEIDYRNKQAALMAHVADLQMAKTSSNSATGKISAEELSSEYQLKSDHANTQQMFENMFGNYEIDNGSIIIKSKMSGQVIYLFEGESEVKESVTLLKVSKQHSPSYGFIKCSPSVVGKIHAGQECHLKVASFPFYEWGTLRGKATEISTAPDENGQFNLKIDFDKNSKMQSLLQTGLTGQAVIIIENKTLLQYFFRNTAKSYHEFAEGDFINTAEQEKVLYP